MWRVLILALASSLGIAEVAAQQFILKGQLTLPDGGELGFDSFGISTLESANSEKIPIDAERKFQKKLRIADYSNSSILFDFPFQADRMMFSEDEPEIRLGSNTADDTVIVKNFAFYRPATYGGKLADEVSKIDASGNCELLSKLGGRLADLSAVPASQLEGPRSGLTILSRSGAKVAHKMLFHQCGVAKLVPVSSALDRFTTSTDFANISTANKVQIGTDLAFAANEIADEHDKRREVISSLLPIFDRFVPGHTSAPVDIAIADLFYAKARFLRLKEDIAGAKLFIKSIVRDGPVKAHKDIEGSLLYDFFLIISGATLTSTEPEYSYNLPLPTEDDFDQADDDDEAEWCWLSKEYYARPHLKRLWDRKGTRTRMRQEMVAMRARSECKGTI